MKDNKEAHDHNIYIGCHAKYQYMSLLNLYRVAGILSEFNLLEKRYILKWEVKLPHLIADTKCFVGSGH